MSLCGDVGQVVLSQDVVEIIMLIECDDVVGS